MNTKKVVLFIVEGVSDQTSLALILSKLIKSENVRFHIINGDITADYDTNAANAITRVYDEIKRFLAGNFFKRSDIFKIVHLIDTDGTFVGKDYIREGEVRGFKYSTECIRARNVEAVLERNVKKSNVVSRLSACSEISKIPYSMYYFSCNLEHVLHGEANMDDYMKHDAAEVFSDAFYGLEDEFINFIRNEELAVPGDFEETWEFIKVGNNSLKRYSNFHLFFG